ncbi:response regulator [Magnetococcus sp. PR-3]|uniref:response regulator n=1 Tax=Magnetococcus sp. PR-3 TaxID=3120355 RepID=UPI002FCE60E5
MESSNDPLESLADRIKTLHDALGASQKIQNALVKRLEQQGEETPFTLFERHALLDQQLRRSRQALRHARQALEGERSRHEHTQLQQKVESLRHQTIVNHASDAILQIHPAGQILYSNPAAQERFGYNQQGFEQCHLSDLFPTEHQSNNQSVMEALQQHEAYGQSLAWTAMGADGALFSVAAFISPPGEGKQNQHTVILHDLSQQLSLLQAQETRRDQALNSDRIWSQLRERISVELRTPLHRLTGMLELLESSTLEAQQLGYVESARHSVETLLHHLESLQDHTSLQASPLASARLPFDLIRLIEETTLQWQAAAKQKDLSLLCILPSTLPAIWEGDLVRLREVISTLLENSIEATTSGEIIITLQATPKGHAPWHEITLTVSDQRPALTPEKAEVMVQFLEQNDQAGRLHDGAESLSLAIIRQLMELMQGRLGFAQDLQTKQTLFTLTLPMMQGQQPERAEQNGLHAKRILILEPHTAYADYLSNLCQHWGMIPHTAHHLDQAVGLWEGLIQLGLPPQYLITPTGLPAHLPWLKKDHEGSQPALIVLGEQAYSNGDNIALNKPVTQQGLYTALRQGAQRVEQQAFSTVEVSTQRQDRILLVEDNPVNQQVALGMLKRVGMQAIAVDRGAKAVVAVKEQPFDLIFMDIQMPEMDGYDTTAAIRQWEQESGTPRQPISALTANAMAGDREQCMAADMDDYLTKPLKQEALWQVMRKWLKDLPERPPQAPATSAASMPATKEVLSKPAEPIESIDATAMDDRKLDELKRMMAVMENGFEEVVTRYLTDTPILLENLSTAITEDNGPQIRQLAHNLKSTSASMGAMALSAQAKVVEDLGKNNQASQAQQWLPTLNTLFTQVDSWIKQRESIHIPPPS